MRDYLFLKYNSKCLQVFFNDLQYIESVDKYVRFVTTRKTYLVLGCLCHLDKQLPTTLFCRIHRSYIVSFRHTSEFSSETVTIAGRELPLSKQYKTLFFDRAQVIYADGNNNQRAFNRADIIVPGNLSLTG